MLRAEGASRVHLIHVEDDRLESELVRATLADHPSAAGLVQASSIAAAARLIDRLQGPMAVLCDNQLPDGTAADLLRHVEGRREVRFVVLSGCITPQIAALRTHPNVVAVFEKPMGLADLERIINTALGRKRQTASN